MMPVKCTLEIGCFTVVFYSELELDRQIPIGTPLGEKGEF
jgi:hypothetical protein